MQVGRARFDGPERVVRVIDPFHRDLRPAFTQEPDHRRDHPTRRGLAEGAFHYGAIHLHDARAKGGDPVEIAAALAEMVHRDREAQLAVRRRCGGEAALVPAVVLEDFEHHALGRQAVEAHELRERAPRVRIVDERGRVHVQEKPAIARIDDRIVAQVQGPQDPVEAHARRAVQPREDLARVEPFAIDRCTGADERLVAHGDAAARAMDRLEVRGERHAAGVERAAASGAHHFPRDVPERLWCSRLAREHFPLWHEWSLAMAG